MEFTQLLAVFFLLVLLVAVLYQIREVVPAKRTLGVKKDTEEKDSYDFAFITMTERLGNIGAPANLHTPVMDASGNLV